MGTTDDVRAGLRAVLNQIPDTMLATQVVVEELATLGSVRGDDGEVSVEKVREFTAKVAAVLVSSVFALDNRLERMEGRPGLPEGFIGQILSEFR